jgi:beta-glucanase (GH16 family)
MKKSLSKGDDMEEYQLVFFEDFLVEGKINSDDWNIQVGEKWANRELQCYTSQLENCHIKDSKLRLIATLHDEGCKYRSARINTKGKHEWQYGIFIIKAKMPKGQGSWPALWFLGSKLSKQIGWPKCGEIDLMEFAGQRPTLIYGSLHSETYNHKINTERTLITEVPDASEQFHEYKIEWTEQSICFFIDDQSYGCYHQSPHDTFSEWPFDQPFYLIINLAVGGMFGGQVVDEDLPYTFEVDWIKVFQKRPKR